MILRSLLRTVIRLQPFNRVLQTRHVSLSSQRLQHQLQPQQRSNTSTLSVERYHQLSDATMDQLVEELETLLDAHAHEGYEVEYHSGVLTLKLGDKGTYVINKQPPNKQIWLSSPFSGPKRYDYHESDDSWRYSRDGKAMSELLNEELSQVFGEHAQLKLLERA